MLMEKGSKYPMIEAAPHTLDTTVWCRMSDNQHARVTFQLTLGYRNSNAIIKTHYQHRHALAKTTTATRHQRKDKENSHSHSSACASISPENVLTASASRCMVPSSM